MKLTIERADLLRSLAHVQSVVERRTTIPILSNVRLDAEGDRLGVTATDMDIAVIERIGCDVAQGGVTTAPAHLLYDIVRKLPEGAQVVLESGADGDHLTLLSGQSRFSLPCQPAEEFPVMAEGEFSHNFVLAASVLKRLIDKARFAISTEETRYYLNGIYLHATSDNGALRAVATDGHRLSRIDAPLPDGAAGMPGVIVPRKTIAEVRKLIDEFDGEVAISLSETKMRVAFDQVVLTSKLIDGTFPDYARVIPLENDKILELDGAVFAQAVDRVSTISTEKTRSVKLSLSKDQLVVSASNPDSGSADEELAVDYDASEIQIGFNSRYLLDVTNQVEGERLRFAMADSASPTVVHDTGDADALYVLMPMRV